MQFKKLKSTHGDLTQITLTEFEKRVFISLFKKASIPFITKDMNVTDGVYDEVRIGHVLQTFLKGVK